MQAEGVEPNTHTYAALITTCNKAGEWRAALEMFDEMRRAAVPVTTVSKKSHESKFYYSRIHLLKPRKLPGH